MKRWAAIVILCLAAILVFGGMSFGQGMACGKHDDLVAALKQHFQEDRHAIGLAGNFGVVELFVSKAGSWTMLVTNPDGQTCIGAAGSAWQTTPAKPAGKDT